MTDRDPTGAEEIFTRALRGLLRPLVRALIANGVAAPTFYRLIKQLYVEVAEEDFALGEGRPTDSRISLITGVHRRDVKAFRDPDHSAAQATRDQVTGIATLLSRWIANPDYCDETGAPRALPKSGETGSFEALARSVSQDIRPRTMLDEVLRQNLVREEAGLLHLHVDAFLGPADLEQKVYFFAENVGDHLSAAVDNLLTDSPQFMERAVFYNRLRPASVDKIEAKAREMGAAVLVELNREAFERQQDDLDAPDGVERFRFGVFFYRERADED